MKKINRPDYRFRMKEIRPFVDFNFGPRTFLDTKKKALISRYFNALNGQRKKAGFQSGLLNRPNILIKRPRSKKRNKLIREVASTSGFPKLKLIPVPSLNPKAKLVFSKDNKILKLKSDKLESVIEFFNKIELVKNTKKEVKRIVDKNPDVKSWQVMAGLHTTSGTFDNPEREVLRLTKKYNLKDQNNYHGNWLNGMIGLTFKKQETLKQFLRKSSKGKRKIKGDLRGIRRKGRI